MKNKKKIYISGCITGNKNAFTEFDGAEHFLKAKGFEVINPMKLDHKENSTWEDFMRADIAELMKCDAIYVLNGWEVSRGATIERDLCLKLNIPVFFEQYKFRLDNF